MTCQHNVAKTKWFNILQTTFSEILKSLRLALDSLLVPKAWIVAEKILWNHKFFSATIHALGTKIGYMLLLVKHVKNKRDACQWVMCDPAW